MKRSSEPKKKLSKNIQRATKNALLRRTAVASGNDHGSLKIFPTRNDINASPRARNNMAEKRPTANEQTKAKKLAFNSDLKHKLPLFAQRGHLI